MLMSIKLVRSSKNPIIEPRPGINWEVGGAFNPGAVKKGDVVHILYRAVNENKISSLGHATTMDGEAIVERSAQTCFRSG